MTSNIEKSWYTKDIALLLCESKDTVIAASCLSCNEVIKKPAKIRTAGSAKCTSYTSAACCPFLNKSSAAIQRQFISQYMINWLTHMNQRAPYKAIQMIINTFLLSVSDHCHTIWKSYVAWNPFLIMHLLSWYPKTLCPYVRVVYGKPNYPTQQSRLSHSIKSRPISRTISFCYCHYHYHQYNHYFSHEHCNLYANPRNI